jgi:hypothetical protein
MSRATAAAVHQHRRIVKTRRSRPPKRVFIGYTRCDQRFLDRLMVHLDHLKRRIDIFTDKRIRPGDKWRVELRRALSRATVAIVLISADYLASAYVKQTELPALLKACQRRGGRILPVIVRASRFARHRQLKEFQAVNDPARPLADMPEHLHDWVFDKVALAVEEELVGRRGRREAVR